MMVSCPGAAGQFIYGTGRFPGAKRIDGDHQRVYLSFMRDMERTPRAARGRYVRPAALLILAVAFMAAGCNKKDETTYLPLPSGGGIDGVIYRQAMRTFVRDISAYARGFDADFIVIPQNGIELVTETGEAAGAPMEAYLGAISGVGQEDLYYGYDGDDTATPAGARDYLIGFLDVAEGEGVEVLVTNYCSTPANMDDAYAQSDAKSYISFAADHRELDNIPAHPATIHGENTSDITSLALAQNFLYVINPSEYASKAAFLAALQGTNYDVVLIDLFFDGTELLPADIASLKTKLNGGARLVICYMSIGEAEDYRYYWNAAWKPGNPEWLGPVNPDWGGNYKVRYWYPEWQEIIFGNDSSYLKKIIDAGFDGVYLDIIDAFEYWE